MDALLYIKKLEEQVRLLSKLFLSGRSLREISARSSHKIRRLYIVCATRRRSFYVSGIFS